MPCKCDSQWFIDRAVVLLAELLHCMLRLPMIDRSFRLSDSSSDSKGKTAIITAKIHFIGVLEPRLDIPSNFSPSVVQSISSFIQGYHTPHYTLGWVHQKIHVRNGPQVSCQGLIVLSAGTTELSRLHTCFCWYHSCQWGSPEKFQGIWYLSDSNSVVATEGWRAVKEKDLYHSQKLNLTCKFCDNFITGALVTQLLPTQMMILDSLSSAYCLACPMSRRLNISVRFLWRISSGGEYSAKISNYPGKILLQLFKIIPIFTH